MFYRQYSTPGTNHGNKYEDHVRRLYEKKMQESGVDVDVHEVGLKLSDSYPFLGTSLDGLVFNNGDLYGLEIKCPYSKFNKSLQEALCDKKIFLHESNGIKLKRRHPYYYQVQGQMFCASLKKVDLVVWFDVVYRNNIL